MENKRYQKFFKEGMGYSMPQGAKRFVDAWMDGNVGPGDEAKGKSSAYIESSLDGGMEVLRMGYNTIAKMDRKKGILYIGHATGNVSQTWVRFTKKMGEASYRFKVVQGDFN